MNNFSLWNLSRGASLVDVLYKGGELGANVAKGDLPGGYKAIDYVENVSNAYDTWLILDHKFNSVRSKLTISYQCVSYSGRYVFGNGASNQSAILLSNSGYYFKTYLSANTLPELKGLLTGIHKVEIGRNELKVDDSTIMTFSTTEQVSPNNLVIGTGCSSAGVPNTNKAMNRIGKVKLEYDSETLYDLIPCINPDGIAGFYDKVNKVFRRSESGSDWTAGYFASPTLIE